MAHEFSGSAVIDRLINDVFEFLADGTNDPKFSPRVQQIRQTTDGPIGVGTVFESTVKDAGMTSHRQFELTEFEPPTKIRWTERSKNAVTVPDGGYDLAQVSDTETKVTIHNVFEGHGFGKLLVGFAARAAVKDAPALAQRIKAAVEAATPASDTGPPVGPRLTCRPPRGRLTPSHRRLRVTRPPRLPSPRRRRRRTRRRQPRVTRRLSRRQLTLQASHRRLTPRRSRQQTASQAGPASAPGRGSAGS